MVTKTTIKTRNKLEAICREERSAEKCVITKNLHKEAKELTKDVDETIALLKKDAAETNKRVEFFESERDALLKDAKLYGVVNDTHYHKSWCALEDDHPSRVEFDAETNRQLKKILTMD